jgi:hypothetical protein
MDRFVVSLFDNFSTALSAVTDLEDNSVHQDDISVIAQDAVLRRSPRLESVDIYQVLGKPRAATFRAIGPVMGSGYIFTYMTERPIHTGSFSLVEMLTKGGVPENDARMFAEAVRRGAVLIAVRESGENAERVAEILDRHDSLVMDDYVREWRQEGWSDFDENADPMDYGELNWPQNITAIPGERQPEPEEERNWPMDITESYEPSTESPEEESWPASITSRDDETREDIGEEEEINWPHNLTARRDE